MKNVHGIISILLAFSAVSIGMLSIALSSVLIAFIYLLLIVTVVLIVARNYCAKCTSRENCNHIIFGKISVFLTEPNKDTYNIADSICVAVPMAVVFLFPQFWLIENIPLFIVFWLLMSIAGVEVYCYVCNRCLNKKCSLCRNKKEF